MGSKTTFAGKTFLWILQRPPMSPRQPVNLSQAPQSGEIFFIPILNFRLRNNCRDLFQEKSIRMDEQLAVTVFKGRLITEDFSCSVVCVLLFVCFYSSSHPFILIWKHTWFVSVSSLCIFMGKHKGNTRNLAINHWNFTGWTSWETTISKKGVVPTRGKIVIKWILWVPLTHRLTPVRALSSGQHLRSNPKLDLSPAAQTLELVCFPMMPSTVLTDPVFILAPSDPNRWWSFLFSASQVHFLGTSVDQLHHPPKHCQHEGRREQ